MPNKPKKKKYDKYGNLLKPSRHLSARDKALMKRYASMKKKS